MQIVLFRVGPASEAGFGQRLREARGIQTQQQVADRAQIARSAYARYETGGRYPSVPELRRLCNVLLLIEVDSQNPALWDYFAARSMVLLDDAVQ